MRKICWADFEDTFERSVADLSGYFHEIFRGFQDTCWDTDRDTDQDPDRDTDWHIVQDTNRDTDRDTDQDTDRDTVHKSDTITTLFTTTASSK